MNKKLKVQGMTMISALLTIGYHAAYADNSNSCTFYAKFIKSDAGFSVESAANDYIDSEDVLQITLSQDDSNKIKINNVTVPYIETAQGELNVTCRSVGSNRYQAACGGYFVDKNISGTAATKSLAYIATLGIGAIIDAGTGFSYRVTANNEAIQSVRESSDILSSNYSAPYIQSCVASINEQRKIQAINQKKQQEEAVAIKKQQDQAKLAYANWLASMPKYRSQLKPSSVTNCGTVIEIKGTMVHIQTGSDARDIWMPLTDIYSYQDNQSRLVGCHDSNRWYKRYGNWVNGDNYYQNGKQYNDEL